MTSGPYIVWNSNELFVFVGDCVYFRSYRPGLLFLAALAQTGASTGSFGRLREDLMVYHLADKTISKYVIEDSRFKMPFPMRDEIVAWHREDEGELRLYSWHKETFVPSSDVKVKEYLEEWKSSEYKGALSSAQYSGWLDAKWDSSLVPTATVNGSTEVAVMLNGSRYVVDFSWSPPVRYPGYSLGDMILKIDGDGISSEQTLLYTLSNASARVVSKKQLKSEMGKSATIWNSKSSPLDPRS